MYGLCILSLYSSFGYRHYICENVQKLASLCPLLSNNAITTHTHVIKFLESSHPRHTCDILQKIIVYHRIVGLYVLFRVFHFIFNWIIKYVNTHCPTVITIIMCSFRYSKWRTKHCTSMHDECKNRIVMLLNGGLAFLSHASLFLTTLFFTHLTNCFCFIIISKTCIQHDLLVIYSYSTI